MIPRQQVCLLTIREKFPVKHLLFGVWLSKPQTDDMREAPAKIIINTLLKAGAKIKAHDPEAMTEARKIFGETITYCDIDYDTLVDADALLVLTEWNEFREPDFARMKKLLKQPVVFDGRNIYAKPVMQKEGFTYYSIGRP